MAHSQGNFIAANALNAVVAMKGAKAIGGMRVIAIGSPVTFWSEASHIVDEYTFANDMVGWTSLNWLFGKESDLDKVGVHAPDYQDRRLLGVGLESPDESQVVDGFKKPDSLRQRVGNWVGNVSTHSFYAYVGELWDKLRAEFP